MKLMFIGGFVTGAATALLVFLWLLSDREVVNPREWVDLTYESPEGGGRFRGQLIEDWRHA